MFGSMGDGSQPFIQDYYNYSVAGGAESTSPDYTEDGDYLEFDWTERNPYEVPRYQPAENATAPAAPSVIPTRKVMADICKVAGHSLHMPSKRLVRVSPKLLSLLRKITPSASGGAEAGLPKCETNEADYGGVPARVLVQIRAELETLMEEALMPQWPRFSSHQRGHMVEGGWYVVLLKLHQLLVALLEDPHQHQQQHQQDFSDEAAEEGGCSFVDTNAAEALSLWCAMVRKAEADAVTSGSQSDYLYGDYHRNNSTTQFTPTTDILKSNSVPKVAKSTADETGAQSANKTEQSPAVPNAEKYIFAPTNEGEVELAPRAEEGVGEAKLSEVGSEPRSACVDEGQDSKLGAEAEAPVTNAAGAEAAPEGPGAKALGTSAPGAESKLTDVPAASEEDPLSSGEKSKLDEEVGKGTLLGATGVLKEGALGGGKREVTVDSTGFDVLSNVDTTLCNTGSGTPPTPLSSSPFGDASSQTAAAPVAQATQAAVLPQGPCDLFVTLQEGIWSSCLSAVQGREGFELCCSDPRQHRESKEVSREEEEVEMCHVDLKRNVVVLAVDLQFLTFSLEAIGRFDAYMVAILWNLLDHAQVEGVLKLRMPDMLVGSRDMIKSRASHALRVFHDCFLEDRWNSAKLEYFIHMILSNNVSAVVDVVADLTTEVWHSQFLRSSPEQMKKIERLLVALMGHSDRSIRTRAVVLLNMFYDQHDWQREVPFVPVITQIGQPFEITVAVDDAADPSDPSSQGPQGVFLILSAPSFEPSAPFDAYSYHRIRWSPWTERSEAHMAGARRLTTALPDGAAAGRRHKWIGAVKFPNFARCGFYDWRVVRACPELGSWEVVQATLVDLRRSSSTSSLLNLHISLTPGKGDNISAAQGQGQVYPHPQRTAELLKQLLTNDDSISFGDGRRTFPLQGRFIVQPAALADEQMHEIFIDQHDARFDEKSGDVSQRGSFASVAAFLPKLREMGVTTVYLMGALARDNGDVVYSSTGDVAFQRPDASPLACTCRATANEMLGGPSGFASLLKEAQRVHIKVIVDSLTRVSSSRPHRKYQDHFLYAVDESGKRQALFGTDGRSAEWEDTCQLNYRKVEAWDILVKDMKSWAALGVHGLRLEHAQSWPHVMDADDDELNRLDPDGKPHYTIMERLLGQVVRPMTNAGYCSTSAVKSWANPFLVKLTKEMWRVCPSFLFLGECWPEPGSVSHAVLARSGVVPEQQGMPEVLCRLFGREIRREDSAVVACPPGNVSLIKDWFDSAHRGLPEGAVVVQSSCSHTSPLPGLLYGRGAWPAVDLLFFLSDVPSTFMGEMEGQAFRMDILNVFMVNKPKQESTTVKKDRASNNNNGRSLFTARSLVNLDAPGPDSNRVMAQLRGLSRFEPVTRMPLLQEELARALGPEFGFDLSKIGGHYAHRRMLRRTFRVFRKGILVPLAVMAEKSVHPKVLAFLRFDAGNGEFVLVAVNFGEEPANGVTVSLKALSQQFRTMDFNSATIFTTFNLLELPVDYHAGKCEGEVLAENLTLAEANLPESEMLSMAELLHEPRTLDLVPFGSVCLGAYPAAKYASSPLQIQRLYASSLGRLDKLVRSATAHLVLQGEEVPEQLDRNIRFNYVFEMVLGAIQGNDPANLATVLWYLSRAIKERADSKAERLQRTVNFHDICVDSGLFAKSCQQFNHEEWKRLCCREGGGAQALLAGRDDVKETAQRLLAKMSVLARQHLATLPPNSPAAEVAKFAHDFVEANNIGPIVFVTTELGKWSTVGGLGVMVDELSCTLAEELGQNVCVISPYYEYNRKGEQGYLVKDGIKYTHNIDVLVAGEKITLGVHEGEVRGVQLIFLHNLRFFSRPYPDFSAPDALRFLSVIGKGALEALCQKELIPQVIVSNDWPTGLVPAYAKCGHFGTVFSGTTFFHIIHNLDASYEGRIYPDRRADLSWVHGLPQDMLVDPSWQTFLYNPSRCALLACDAWGTVSPSYRDELRGTWTPSSSPLAPLLNRYKAPFAYPNGVPLKLRLKRLQEQGCKTHEEAKSALQQKYFGFAQPDANIPLFAFIGRITSQKGVHLILDAAEQMIQRYQCKIQLLVGGKVNWADPYSARCGHRMRQLRERYPFSFWADPNEFFSDGPIVNLGADVALMPSAFEPGGIVQHEFFIAGTPVLAFRTGGLKDTVYEFDVEKLIGNGFTFESYTLGDFLYATERAYRVVKDPAKYRRLRENAQFSVVSCEQVAQAWLHEFCRLRRKIPVSKAKIAEIQRSLAPWDAAGWSASASDLTSVVAKSSVYPSATGASGNAMVTDLPKRRAYDTTEPLSTSSSSSPTTTTKDTDEHRSPTSSVAPVKIRYVPKGGVRPRAMAVAGSFDDWLVRRPLFWDNALQAFIINLALKPGTYRYKLIVDGDWVCNPDAPTEQDAKGNINNVLVV